MAPEGTRRRYGMSPQTETMEGREMTTCAASGMPLAGEGWEVDGLEGVYCRWHAALLDLGAELDEQTPDHWLLDHIADAVGEGCPNPAVPIPPPPPLDLEVPPLPEKQDETEAELLARLWPVESEPKLIE